MSHFKIIQLDRDPVTEDNVMTEEDVNEDALLLMSSDGWEPDDEPDAFQNVKSRLSKIGKVLIRKKTFTFTEKETLLKNYTESMESVFRNWRSKIESKQFTMGEFQLRTDVREACGVDDLFYYDGYLHNASGLIADFLAGYVPEKMHIGAIFDCHR